MKPLKIKNYGSIPHLHGSRLGKHDKYIHKGQHDILTKKTRDKHDYIIVTEKYDGSNVGITNVNNKIYALTRSGYLAETSPYKQHHYFAKWVEKNKNRFKFIGEGERLVGEWLLQVCSLRYEIKDEPFVAFDYFTKNNERLRFIDLQYLSKTCNFHIVRVVFCGNNSFSIKDALQHLKNGDVNFKTENPEGLVYRCERKDKFEFAAKYVRNDFEPGKHIIGVNESELIWNMNPELL